MDVLDNLNSPTDNYGKRTVNEVLEQGYQFDFGLMFNQAFGMLKLYWGPMLGLLVLLGVASSIIVFACVGSTYVQFIQDAMQDPESIAQNMVGFIFSIIGKALLALVLVWIFLSPMQQGYLLMFRDGETMGAPGPFGSIFDAYKNGRWLKILAIVFLMYIIVHIWQYLPYLFFWNDLQAMMDFESMIENPQAFNPASTVTMSLLSYLMYIPMFFFFVLYSLAIPIMFFQNLGVWQSMEASRKIVMKRFWNFAGYYFVIGLIAFLGILACCVGILVTYPLLMYAGFVIYRDIFVNQATESNSSSL
ncbi:MAG: hypothetical protein ACKVOR_13620 [Flavobacteriales bacterium]